MMMLISTTATATEKYYEWQNKINKIKDKKK